ncbi:MAG: dihydrofolate reductase family protein [Opitutae bacterium]|nr:dihydrofolate reductase family protein [Opitutae bacterium]
MSGGGIATVREYLQAGLIDGQHVAVAPVVLGRGENLFAGIDLRQLGYKVAEHVTTPAATHVLLKR